MEELKVPKISTSYLSLDTSKAPSFFTFSTQAFHSRLHLGIYKSTKLNALPRMATSSKTQLASMDSAFLTLRLSTCSCCSLHLKPTKLKSLVKPAFPFSLLDTPIPMATTLPVSPVAMATCHVSSPHESVNGDDVFACPPRKKQHPRGISLKTVLD